MNEEQLSQEQQEYLMWTHEYEKRRMMQYFDELFECADDEDELEDIDFD